MGSMTPLTWYLLMGLWTYIVLVAARLDTFKNHVEPQYVSLYLFTIDLALFKSLLRGFLLCVLLWPVAPLICIWADGGKDDESN